MSETTQPLKPQRPDEPAQIKIEQQVGAMTGGKVVGVEVYHSEQVIIEAGGAAAAPEPGNPPYKCQDFYDVADSPLFFGREKLTAELVAFVRDHAFLAIVGASGSGKSAPAWSPRCCASTPDPWRTACGPRWAAATGATSWSPPPPSPWRRWPAAWPATALRPWRC